MNFVKACINTFFTRIFVYLSMVCISIYIARILGPEARGTYALLTQFVFISVLLVDFGIQNASVYFLGKGESLSRVYPNILSLSLVASLLTSVCSLVFFNVLRVTFLKNISASLILIAIFSIPFKILTEISSSVILGMNKIKLLNALRITHFLLLLVTFLAFVIVLKLKLEGAMLGFVATELIMVLVYLIALSKWSRIYLGFEPTFLKKLLQYGLRGFLGPLCILLLFRLDFFLLNYFKDPKSVGFYSIAVSLVELLYLVPELIGMILFPKLTSAGSQNINRNTMQVLRVIFFVLTLATLFLFASSRWIIVLIYGRQYVASVALMRILLPGFLAMSLYYIFFSYFYSRGRPEIVTLIIFLTLLFKVILAFVLIPNWGIKGAAICSTVTYSFCALTFIVVFLKYSKTTLPEAFFIKASDWEALYKRLSPMYQFNEQA